MATIDLSAINPSIDAGVKDAVTKMRAHIKATSPHRSPPPAPRAFPKPAVYKTALPAHLSLKSRLMVMTGDGNSSCQDVINWLQSILSWLNSVLGWLNSILSWLQGLPGWISWIPGVGAWLGQVISWLQGVINWLQNAASDVQSVISFLQQNGCGAWDGLQDFLNWVESAVSWLEGSAFGFIQEVINFIESL
jgi:hypothetical protein